MLCPECLKTVMIYEGRFIPHRANGTRCPMSHQPPLTWTERSTRNAVANRSGGICEYCGAARATECHHRIPRSVGGVWSPANIVHLCHDCHDRITNHPASAQAHGLHLHSKDDPTRIPLTRASGHIVLLSDDVAAPRRKRAR